MNFEVPEFVRLLQSQVDEFIEREIAPIESEFDQFLGEHGEWNLLNDDHELVDEFFEIRDRIQEKSVEAGFYDMHMPEKVGGGGLSLLEFLLVIEHIYNRHPDGFHHLMMDLLSVSPGLLACQEDDFQREQYLEPVLHAEKHLAFALTEPDHGSDITWMDTTAEKDGDDWSINGTKCFTSHAPEADFAVVHARTSGDDGSANGISTFFVEKDNPGWEVGKIQHPMGGDVGRHSFNHFSDCRVPEKQMFGEEGSGFIDMAMQLVGWTRLHLSAEAVGRSQWLFDQAVDYADHRIAFGSPIGDNQFIQGKIADMRTEIEQVRWLYRYAAWLADEGDSSRWLECATKLCGAELWHDVADETLQIHGGAGYFRSLPFEHELRAARGFRIYDGTDEIMRRNIAREFLS